MSATALAGTAPAPPPPPPKGKITVLQDQWGDDSADLVSAGVAGTYKADRDPGSLYTVTRAIGARAAWGLKDPSGRAVTGQGVTVALLDSGLAPVPGLTRAGKVVQGPDLSLETNSDALRGLDTFGHGTHLGAIIGAADTAVPLDPSGQPKPTSTGDQLGVAPGASLLPLKLATSNGSTDVSQVIAGLDWVTQHAHDPGVNVRVVNLSFGTDSLQPYQVDPIAAAAENAWRHGIVVVVSGGNEGPAAGRLTDPAVDPYVIAVGASDPDLSVSGWGDPDVADFSQGGSSARHVDLLAPGRSITSLRDPGSAVDVEHPEGLVDGDSSGRLFRGSGTSQAAAVVSGAAALVLQANPALTPDQVKAALVSTAKPLAGVSTTLQGAGQLTVADAVKAAQAAGKLTAAQAASVASAVRQTYPAATGLGSLELARGGSHLADPVDGTLLSGEVDVQDQPFVAARWAAASAAGTAWTGGTWNGAAWTGTGWSGSTAAPAGGFSGMRWSSSSWSGVRWSGMRWSDVSWDGMRWSGSTWSGSTWSGVRWSDSAWDGMRWSDTDWS